MIDVAVCGLGLMGRPIAIRLAEAGHRVRVWDRTPAKALALAGDGLTAAPSPEAAASGAVVVIVMVSDIEAVRSVVDGPNGIAAGRPQVIAQMSTVAPHELLALAARLPPELRMIDTPVTGSVPQAATGQLRVLTAGDDRACATAMPVLETLGTPVRCGALGAASALKCVLNACTAPMIALLAEGLALADTLDLDQELVLDELERTRVGPLVIRKRSMIESGEFPADSRLKLFVKDMGVLLDTAGVNGAQLRLAREALTLATAATAAGRGDQDYSALVGHLRDR